MGKKSFGTVVSAAKETIEQRTREEVKPQNQGKPVVMYKEDCVRKSFLMRTKLNTEFNIAAAKLGIDKGLLLNQIVEEWLERKRDEL